MVSDANDVLKHAAEQGVPKLHLGIPGLDQPVGFGAPCRLVKNFMLGEGIAVDHAQGDGQRVHEGLWEVSLYHHFPGAAGRQQQRPGQHAQRADESVRA